MLPDNSSNDDRLFMQRTVEAAIRIGAIAALIIWCFLIAQPFLVPIVWGAIIAVAVFHGYKRLVTWLGGRRVTAAVLATLSMLVLLVVPSVLLGKSLVSGASYVVELLPKRGTAHSATTGGHRWMAADWRTHRQSLDTRIRELGGGTSPSQSPI